MELSGIGLFSTYTYSYVLENIVLLKRVFVVKINIRYSIFWKFRFLFDLPAKRN